MATPEHVRLQSLAPIEVFLLVSTFCLALAFIIAYAAVQSTIASTSSMAYDVLHANQCFIECRSILTDSDFFIFFQMLDLMIYLI